MCTGTGIFFVLQTFCSSHQEKSYNELIKYKTSCFDECRKGLKSKGREQNLPTIVEALIVFFVFRKVFVLSI